MDDVLTLCHGLPSRSFEPGESLLHDGGVGSAMFVLVTGEVEIRQGSVVFTRVSEPGSFLAVARLLALRLQAVTTYLSDIKRQYATTDGHLAMMDQVLSQLTSMRPGAIEPGSKRGGMPDD